MENLYKKLSLVNPQRDNGHRRINSDVWRDLMRVNLTAAGYKVILCVIDRTWGYDQLEAAIGYSVFAKATGLSKVSIRNGIKEAAKKRLLCVEPGDFRSAARYLFNKHWDTWDGLPVKDFITGKPTNTDTSVKLLHSPGKPLTNKPSYAIKNNTKNKKGENISLNIKEKEKTPDRSDKYVAGKFGHMVDK